MISRKCTPNGRKKMFSGICLDGVIEKIVYNGLQWGPSASDGLQGMLRHRDPNQSVIVPIAGPCENRTSSNYRTIVAKLCQFKLCPIEIGKVRHRYLPGSNYLPDRLARTG